MAPLGGKRRFPSCAVHNVTQLTSTVACLLSHVSHVTCLLSQTHVYALR